jgi:putative transposase
METRTICCKLVTAPSASKALAETSERFAGACNYVLKVAAAEKTHNAIKLHKLCYNDVRKLFGLSANLSVRAIRRVVASMTKLKGKRKRPKEFKPKSIDYDARIFSYQEVDETVSLRTISGRIRVSMLLGEYQRKWLIGQNPTSATVINKAGVWYIHIVCEVETAAFESDGVMGVDLGITNIATTSELINPAYTSQTCRHCLQLGSRSGERFTCLIPIIGNNVRI